MLKLIACFAYLFACCALLPPASAATFFFSNATPSDLQGLHTGTVAKPEVDVTFTAGPGSSIISTDAGRLGVDSRSNPGVADPFTNKLNILGGSLAGQGESLIFSFNRSGVLNKLFFDGIKDESLEYFTLRLPNGSELSLFDFEAEFRLNYQGFDGSDLGVPNFTMADDAADDFSTLAIPFKAGQVFTLIYGQIDYAVLLPGYIPKNSQGIPTGDIANGARFEGLGATIVPEPSALTLFATIIASIAGVCSRLSTSPTIRQ